MCVYVYYCVCGLLWLNNQHREASHCCTYTIVSLNLVLQTWVYQTMSRCVETQISFMSHMLSSVLSHMQLTTRIIFCVLELPLFNT